MSVCLLRFFGPGYVWDFDESAPSTGRKLLEARAQGVSSVVQDVLGSRLVPNISSRG